VSLDVRFNNILSGTIAFSSAPTSLRELWLSNNALGYVGTVHLAAWLSDQGKNLEHLAVADCSIPSAGLCRLGLHLDCGLFHGVLLSCPRHISLRTIFTSHPPAWHAQQKRCRVSSRSTCLTTSTAARLSSECAGHHSCLTLVALQAGVTLTLDNHTHLLRLSGLSRISFRQTHIA
jgi:hypothetical protein